MTITWGGGALMFAAGALSGALNAVAGGGSFIAFPALLALGVPAISANATNTVGLWPASLAGAAAGRTELARERGRLFQLSIASAVGGLAGALLLLLTPPHAFTHLLPFLVLLATLLFAYGKRLATWLGGGSGGVGPLAAGAFQFVIGVYGGYYGGGVGIMMLAGLALAGMEDMAAMNALKNALTALINGVAVLTFAWYGAVAWPWALVMAAGAFAGGYLAARFARRVDPRYVRSFVIVLGIVLTGVFFYQAWRG